MSLTPKINKNETFYMRTCPCCNAPRGSNEFAPVKSVFFPNKTSPICDKCIDKMINEEEGNWRAVNKLCQMADIPFVPKEWVNIYEANPAQAFHRYAEVFQSSEFESLGWEDYFQAFKELKEQNAIEVELPELGEAKIKEQKEKWGHGYDNEALNYLDRLYDGLMATQNVNGTLQIDQAIKLCKISYAIDQRIEEGVDFDKLLNSYDKLVKIAEFTPKNAKNINDFDTVGEVFKWLEKKGWVNTFYDNVSRDIVDETLKNIQSYNQRLYTNETGIGDQISERINNLKRAEELEERSTSGARNSDYYGTGSDPGDLDSFENEGFEGLFGDEDEQEFNPDMEGMF